jgi:hypothetical protein
MKSNKLLSEIAGKINSRAAIVMFVAGSFLSTGCNKKDISQAERQSG